MKICATMSVVAVILTIMTSATPAAEPAQKPVDLRGEIVRVEGKSIVVLTSAKRGAPKQVTVPTDDKTVVTLEDDRPGTVADLQAGHKVRVTPEMGTAAKIEVRGKKK